MGDCSHPANPGIHYPLFGAGPGAARRSISRQVRSAPFSTLILRSPSHKRVYEGLRHAMARASRRMKARASPSFETRAKECAPQDEDGKRPQPIASSLARARAFITPPRSPEHRAEPAPHRGHAEQDRNSPDRFARNRHRNISTGRPAVRLRANRAAQRREARLANDIRRRSSRRLPFRPVNLVMEPGSGVQLIGG
jgi:hypothetical protein